MSRLSETAESNWRRWVQPHVIKIYCPTDLNVSCVRSGCVTFGNVIVTNRNPGRRASVEVGSPHCQEESYLWVPSTNFELAVSETRAISLGMFVTPQAEVLRKRCLQFEIRFGPSQRIRERYPQSSTLHSEVVNFSLVPLDNGLTPLNIVHSCFRNRKHDRICRVQWLEANERQPSYEDEHENEVSREGSIELIEPVLGHAAEQRTPPPRRILEDSTGEFGRKTDDMPDTVTTDCYTGGILAPALVLFQCPRWSILILTTLLSVALCSAYSSLRLGLATNRFRSELVMAYMRFVNFLCRLCHMHIRRLMQRQRPRIDYIPSKAIMYYRAA